MSDSTPTQIRLDHYPTGIPGDDAWNITHDPTPELVDGQVEVDVQLISIDPGMKGWITPMRSYMPPIEPGDVMRSFSIGPVTRTASDRFQVGDVVTGFLGVQTTAVVDARAVRPCDVSVAPMELHLGVLGMTGFTGYFGMLDIGRPEASHTVVVSAASGAVGSVAAQVAKRCGARVVGIAGGPDKCAYLVDDLGLDAAVDYKSTERSIADELAAATPNGIDVYFDNVGGEILEAVLQRINDHARIVLCGGISGYDDMAGAAGPAGYMKLVTTSSSMQGFTMKDYFHRIPEAFADLSGWVADGSLRHREHIVDGIERFPEALRMLFTGRNHGKLLLRP
ncbi:NADP-dependent oxidoreductase [uncultured Ilumatobacter sp.]|uniref:NADP-dependent oxidoreductase n=1 Tax=uncultured Ilumatobacter sp. TaxID=879968 RepID=UPI00374E9488